MTHPVELLPETLRTYAEQLPTVLSVPNLAQALRDAADEIESWKRVARQYASELSERGLL